MLREDIVWLIIPTIVAIFQYSIWSKKTKQQSNTETLIPGHISNAEISQAQQTKHIYLYIFLFQLIIPILTITNQINLNFFLKVTGYFGLFFGIIISLSSLRIMDNNWSPLLSFQIKHHHQLITNGPYQLVRHPIYLSVILQTLSFELIANSWLSILLTIPLFIYFNYRANEEEKLLTNYFHDQYSKYKNKTKKIIPFIY